MADQRKPLEKLLILRDDPLFWGDEPLDPALDAFNHEAYARAIFEILNENQPPLSIGLFGPWGIGKSTIVSILFKLISQSSEAKLTPVYFNAWKYSGDAFRRQLLIEVAKQVYCGKADRDTVVLRLEKLNYTDVLRETTESSVIGKIKDLLTLKGVKFQKAGLARLLFAGIVLLIGLVISVVAESFYPVITGLLSAVVAFLMGMKFEDVFVIQETSVYDPKLIFPEQFEVEFRNLVGPAGPLESARPVIVIDDIDRCEPATIRDILISVKTFLGQENCFFIVPCDDRAVVQVFSDPNQKQGYQDELLRKYFNVGIRIAPLMATDLVDFANGVSKRTGMPPSVVQMAILANYRDARKMKHFLNTFSVKYGIAKARTAGGFMPVNIDQNLAGFAKAVLIEDLFPDLFSKMVEHPEIYSILESAALNGAVNGGLKKFGLEDWEADYRGLRAILEKTRDVKVEHIEVFLSLKTTNPEARIPRGFELKNSIVQGDESATEEIVGGVSTDEVRASLTQLLIGLLNSATDTFLKNTVAAALRWYFREGLLAPQDRPTIAFEVSQALAFNDQLRVLQQRASAVLQCAQDAKGDYAAEIVGKFERELSLLVEPPDSLAETANALFKVIDRPSDLSEILNKKFEGWIGTEKGLKLLLQIETPQGLVGPQKLPSLSVLQKIASGISPEAADATVAINRMRKQVLYKNWDADIAPTIAAQFLLILQQAASDTSYSPRIDFVLQAVIENPECVDARSAPSLWAQTQTLYNRFGDPAARRDIHRAVLVFAATCPDAGTRQAAKTFAIQNWQTFNDEQLREVLEFLPKFDSAVQREFRTALVEQERVTLQGELQNPTNRSKERLAMCFQNRDVLTARAVEVLLDQTLQTPDQAFETWRIVIPEYARELGDEFSKNIAEKILSLLPGSYAASRRQSFLSLFVTILPLVEERSKPLLLTSYFSLCKHGDQNVRNPATNVLGDVRKAVDEQDFKLGLNSLVRDFCRMAPAEVMNFGIALDAALQHSALFGDYEWRDLADLAQRALSQADSAIQEFGLSLAERLPSFPAQHEDDLVHVLIGVARRSESPLKDRADKILRKLVAPSLGGNARRGLEDYLNPPKAEQDETSEP